MLNLDFPLYDFKIRKTDQNVTLIFDELRKKYVNLTPEEWVRQHILRMLKEKKYPVSLTSVEKEIKLFSTKKRFDILVSDTSGNPFLLVECKAPEVKITQKVFDQLSRYNTVLNAPLLLVSNGKTHYYLKFENNEYQFLKTLPDYYH